MTVSHCTYADDTNILVVHDHLEEAERYITLTYLWKNLLMDREKQVAYKCK